MSDETPTSKKSPRRRTSWPQASRRGFNRPLAPDNQPDAILDDAPDDDQFEREWNAIMRSPKGQETLRKLVAQASEEIARGEVGEGGCGN